MTGMFSWNAETLTRRLRRAYARQPERQPAIWYRRERFRYRSSEHAEPSSGHACESPSGEEGGDMGMAATETKIWTLEEVHSLPDDGNKYELIRGELFVTPPPTDYHETIGARLTRLLDPFVAANGLGLVYHPRAVMRFEGSEVEPDLMVRKPHPRPEKGWDSAPKPTLIVEILSDYTRRRDREQKKSFYLEAGV